MSLELYLAYVLACILITIIPGPTVTLIIANSLTHGMRAGLLNVTGTQLGLAIMLGVLLVGLSSIIATMGWWFDWVRIAGAVYLVWLGWKLLRANAGFGHIGQTPAPHGGFLLQGFLVLMSNPKVQPITVALNNLAGSFSVQWNIQMAGALLAALPTLLVYIFLGRYFMRGLLAGSLKG